MIPVAGVLLCALCVESGDFEHLEAVVHGVKLRLFRWVQDLVFDHGVDLVLHIMARQSRTVCHCGRSQKSP